MIVFLLDFYCIAVVWSERPHRSELLEEKRLEMTTYYRDSKIMNSNVKLLKRKKRE